MLDFNRWPAISLNIPSKVSVALVVKNPSVSEGHIRDTDLIPESGRSPGGGNGNHFSILAWRTPWTEEPGGR